MLLSILESVLTKPRVSQVRTAGASPDVVPMLRAHGLEILDDQGRVRASISLHGPSRFEGKDYPAGVLLRLINSRGGPVVKIGASENGAGITVTDGSREFNGVQLLAIDTGTVLVKVHSDRRGEQILKP